MIFKIFSFIFIKTTFPLLGRNIYSMENEIKICKYNHCNNIIEDSKRKHSIFCCRNCKNKNRRQSKNIIKKINKMIKGRQDI